jgi:hypothetical protein
MRGEVAVLVREMGGVEWVLLWDIWRVSKMALGLYEDGAGGEALDEADRFVPFWIRLRKEATMAEVRGISLPQGIRSANTGERDIVVTRRCCTPSSCVRTLPKSEGKISRL